MTVSKTFGQDVGLSCCYRQHRDDGHCQYLHGYCLSFHIEFGGMPDVRGWVIPFGKFGKFRDDLKAVFDHTLLVETDDPQRQALETLQGRGLAQVRIMPQVGAEAFAKFVYQMASLWLRTTFGFEVESRNLHVVKVRCDERPGNSATYAEEAMLTQLATIYTGQR